MFRERLKNRLQSKVKSQKVGRSKVVSGPPERAILAKCPA
jgi:hypothetical protein